MKRLLYIVLFLFISISGFSQAKKTIVIGILSDHEINDGGKLQAQLKKEIKAIAGNNTKVIFKPTLYNDFNLKTAEENYKQLISGNSNVILSFGVINHLMLEEKERFPKPTIIVGTVRADFGDKVSQTKTSGVNNLTYLISPVSSEKDLDTFYSLYEFEKVGIVIDKFLPQVLEVEATYKKYFSDKKADFKLIEAENVEDVIAQLEGIDAIYIAGLFHDSEAKIKQLISAVNAKKIPSFSSFSRKDVENGMLATNQPETNFDLFFRRIALNIESITSGKNAKDLPVFVSYEQELTVNYNTAQQIDFPIRYSLLAKTNFIGAEIEIEGQKKYTIVDIMKGVVADNLNLNAQEKNIDLSGQDVKLAKSNYLPSVSASAGATYIDPEIASIFVGPEFSTSGAVTLQQTILSEQANANISITKNQLKAQQESYNATELDAILDASLVYFDALVAKTNARIQNQNLLLTRKNLQISEQNFEVGESGKSDVLRFKSQLAQNTQALIEASNNLQQRFYAINQLLNKPITEKIDVATAEVESGVFQEYKYGELRDLLDNPKLRKQFTNFLVEEAKINSPELKNIGYTIEANNRNYKLNSTGRFIPTVALQGQYNIALTQSGVGSLDKIDPRTNYNVGLNLSIPIFQRNQQNINKQTALFQGEQLSLNKGNIELNIEKSVNDLVLNLVNQIANIEISKVALKTAEESLDLTQNAYSEGAVPLIQLIDAQNNYLQSQLTSATANYNYLLTSLQLERSIGYFFLMNTPESNQQFIQRANEFILNKN